MTCPGLQSWKLQAGLPDSYSVLFTGCWVLWMEHVPPAPLVYRNLIPHVIGRWGSLGGHEGRALINGIDAQVKDPRALPPLLCHVRTECSSLHWSWACDELPRRKKHHT